MLSGMIDNGDDGRGWSLPARNGLMLLLLFKNFLWAAWWPYCTMLLAMEKAAQQPGGGSRPPPRSRVPEPPPQDRGQHRQQESVMASDAFKPEVPEPLRELMKMSIEQAQRAFEAFISTSEKTWKSLETISPSGRASLYALNAKIVEITRRNAEANFALAMKLAESKDVHQAMELQSRHVREQMETFVRQLEEMRDLTAQIIHDSNPARTDVSSARTTPPGGARAGLSAVGSSPYAPSSSYPPGETGRTY
jgi:phasin